MNVIDIYHLLFGRTKIKDGDVISMSEHGRVGGVSTGQPFKFTDLVNYDIKLVEDGSYTYVGYAKPGTAEATEAWKVMRIDQTSGMKITWANNSTEFENAVTDMASLFS